MARIANPRQRSKSIRANKASQSAPTKQVNPRQQSKSIRANEASQSAPMSRAKSLPAR